MKSYIKYPWFKPFKNNNYIKNSLPKIIKNNKATMGEYSKKLENELTKILKVKHVVLTTSGTSALMMATLALGIGPGKKVICTDMTWIATINPSLICKSKIYLVDTLPKSQKVCFKNLNNLIKKIKPDLVILVHLSGENVYNKEFNYLKKKLDFNVIEDASQSFFVKNQEQKYCGTSYDIGCFSLSITKIINMVYGGFCVTNSSKLAENLITIRNNGVNAEPENAKLELANQPGLNLKPSDLHSCIGYSNLKHRKQIIKRVNKIYLTYKKKLKNNHIELLDIDFKNMPTIYVLAFVKNRNKFYNFCRKKNLEIHLGIRGIHETKIINPGLSFPNSKYISKNLVRLPCGPGYTVKEISKIINLLNLYKK